MPESNITSSLIPLAKPEDCGEVYQNSADACTVTSKNPKFSAKILYPEGFLTVKNLPLAGGAILSISYPDYKSSAAFTSDEIISLFSNDLNKINEIQDTGDL